MFSLFVVGGQTLLAEMDRYQRMTLYDGLVGQPDDYHQWINRQDTGKKTAEVRQRQTFIYYLGPYPRISQFKLYVPAHAGLVHPIHAWYTPCRTL